MARLQNKMGNIPVIKEIGKVKLNHQDYPGRDHILMVRLKPFCYREASDCLII